MTPRGCCQTMWHPVVVDRRCDTPWLLINDVTPCGCWQMMWHPLVVDRRCDTRGCWQTMWHPMVVDRWCDTPWLLTDNVTPYGCRQTMWHPIVVDRWWQEVTTALCGCGTWLQEGRPWRWRTTRKVSAQSPCTPHSEFVLLFLVLVLLVDRSAFILCYFAYWCLH